MELNVHDQFLEIAPGVSMRLAEDIRAVGPVGFPKRRRMGLAPYLSRAVVGQQLSLSAARTIWGRIEAAAEASRTPLLDFFREENADTIRACGLSRNKTRALICIREAHETGTLDITKVRAMDHESRTGHLSRIWGVGLWTCDMTSLFYFQDPDIWPLGDVTVQKTFASYIGRRKPEKAASRFAPYRSYLALYLWRIVDATP